MFLLFVFVCFSLHLIGREWKSRQKVPARIWKQEMKQTPGGALLTGYSPWIAQPAFTQDHLLRGGPTHGGLGPCVSITDHGNAL